jgi:dodecin
MSDPIYKLTEIVGSSREGSDQAIKNALGKAAESIRNIRWFDVVATRGFVDRDGKTQFQVTLKIGFTLE